MTTVTKPLIFLTTLLILSGCLKTTKYRPSIYGHDYLSREIIEPKTHRKISTGDPEFNRYASVKLEDLTKLALLLKHAKVPHKVRRIIERFSKEVKQVKKQNNKLLNE